MTPGTTCPSTSLPLLISGCHLLMSSPQATCLDDISHLCLPGQPRLDTMNTWLLTETKHPVCALPLGHLPLLQTLTPQVPTPCISGFIHCCGESNLQEEMLTLNPGLRERWGSPVGGV